MTGSTADLRAMRQTIITVNGPGEISAWLTPLSRAIKRIDPEMRVAVCLVPCVFSSGAERAVVERIDTVDAVADVAQSMGLILRRRLPEGFLAEARTLVVHLGGELALTRMLARRLSAPAFAYVEHPVPALKHFERIFYNGLNRMPDRIGARKTEPLGEMMVDSAAAKLAALGPRERLPRTVAIVPGSRAYMAEVLLPYFAETAARIAATRPDITFISPKSDYIDPEWYRSFPAPPADRDWTASPVSYRAEGGDEWFETAKGTRIGLLPNPEVLATAGAALTLPGTNTGELAAAGVPMVTVLPTYRACAEGVPLPGLAGHVARIPVIGRELKVFAAGMALKRQRLLSIPSRRMGRMLAPELIGQNLHDRMAEAVIGLVDEPDRATARSVREAMGPVGAAHRLADTIVARLGAHAATPVAV